MRFDTWCCGAHPGGRGGKFLYTLIGTQQESPRHSTEEVKWEGCGNPATSPMHSGSNALLGRLWARARQIRTPALNVCAHPHGCMESQCEELHVGGFGCGSEQMRDVDRAPVHGEERSFMRPTWIDLWC